MSSGNEQDPLLKVYFENASSKRFLSAEIFAPRQQTTFNEYVQRELTSWQTEYTIHSEANSELLCIGGEDWLQAFLLAIEGVRRRIPHGEEDQWLTADGRPSWVVLPRLIPISWGYDLYKTAERAIETVEQNFIDQIERRRQGR